MKLGSRRVLWRYIRFQIPVNLGLLVLWLASFGLEFLPTKWIGFTLLFWLIKDALLYPFLWRSYDTHQQERPAPMQGQTGIVIRDLNPEGVIRVRGEYWNARVMDENDPIAREERVLVKDRRNLLLLVTRPQDHAREP